ncbi:hypothetical protein SAY86_001918 [Trapa natans]|uniref:Uncharacterized protein n=1 Tax=Trapa natans TaxID=22666 RepID=A0AAN7LIB8_TRANT|nr:hypothetical protein SAY86_001918 [Trapa natans]
MCIGPSSESHAPDSPVHYGSETEGAVAVMARADRRRLSRQISSAPKAPRDAVWERRRWEQVTRKKHHRKSITDTMASTHRSVCSESDVTDEDLCELKGCIELGFRFKEEEGQALCTTLPALDLYFAVNRHLSPSLRSTHQGHSPWSPSGSSPSSPSGSTTSEPESWKICSPGENPTLIKRRAKAWKVFDSLKIWCFAGENPEQVKVKLRHWAQAHENIRGSATAQKYNIGNAVL